MADNQNNNLQKQAGAGSAENKGNERSEQVNQQINFSQMNKQDIAAQIGENESSISSIKETGGLSGRDDASGGTADRMEEQNTGQETGR